MSSALPFFPQSASAIAPDVDALFFFILAVSVFFAVLVSVLILVFTFKFRGKNPGDAGADIHGSLTLELLWTGIPFVIAMVMFAWGAQLYFTFSRPPADAMDVFVTGKQWMWKVQHPEGVREINELHIPIGRPVRLTMGSEDVIHDFFIPAFRTKMDVVPGRLTTMWFTATEVGEYHIFCSQYCGTKHSGMVGTVVAMLPEDYEAWLAGGRSTGSAAQNGERLFTDLSCITCHKSDSKGRGPWLGGVFGSTVTLADGRKVLADENYIRESIMAPTAKVVQGYQPIMPTFQGLISEENLIQLIAYIKTLKPAEPAPAELKK